MKQAPKPIDTWSPVLGIVQAVLFGGGSGLTSALFCLAIKSDLAGQLNREVASSVRLKITHSSVSISLKQDGLHCQESKARAVATRQPKGSAHVKDFV
jgi:hypothetical protein